MRQAKIALNFSRLASDPQRMQPGESFLWGRWLRLAHLPSGLVGLILVILHMGLALAAPLIIPYDPVALDTTAIRAAPSRAHLFGTDKLGRDILTRTLLGGRTALLVTTAGIGIAVIWGGVLGITLAYLGGILDEVVMRLVDALLALPRLLILLVIASVFGTGNAVLIPALGVLYGVEVIRVARATTREFVACDFVLAAYAIGARQRTVVFYELLPNVLDLLLVEGALRWSWMLLSFSSLSFLGFGVTPPTPDWGLMIAESRTLLALAPWTTFFPLAALSTLIIGVNLLAGALAKAIGAKTPF